MKLAVEKGASEEALQKILEEKTRVIYLGTGEKIRYLRSTGGPYFVLTKFSSPSEKIQFQK